MAQKNAPFFILGTQRSGTTLLRLILNSHSDVAIPEEARFLTPILNKNYASCEITGDKLIQIISYLRANEQLKLWNYDKKELFKHLESIETIGLSELIELLYESYARSEGKSRWGDKSLFFGAVELLNQLFPEARFIHIVRDGRDVFHSWRTMDPDKNYPAVMALDWNYKLYKIDSAFKFVPKERCMTIRYEDLLIDPSDILNSICSFLGIKFEETMLDFHKTSHKYIGEHHSKLIFNAINNSNLEKWKTKLSKKEVKAYELFAGNNLRKYGYKISDKRITIIDISYAILDLTVGLPKRIWQVIRAHWAYRRALRQGAATKSIAVGVMPKDISNNTEK